MPKKKNKIVEWVNLNLGKNCIKKLIYIYFNIYIKICIIIITSREKQQKRVQFQSESPIHA